MYVHKNTPKPNWNSSFSSNEWNVANKLIRTVNRTALGTIHVEFCWVDTFLSSECSVGKGYVPCKKVDVLNAEAVCWDITVLCRWIISKFTSSSVDSAMFIVLLIENFLLVVYSHQSQLLWCLNDSFYNFSWPHSIYTLWNKGTQLHCIKGFTELLSSCIITITLVTLTRQSPLLALWCWFCWASHCIQCLHQLWFLETWFLCATLLVMVLTDLERTEKSRGFLPWEAVTIIY